MIDDMAVYIANLGKYNEDAAIFEENQRIRIFLELRELRSNGAIRRYQFAVEKGKRRAYYETEVKPLHRRWAFLQNAACNCCTDYNSEWHYQFCQFA